MPFCGSPQSIYLIAAIQRRTKWSYAVKCSRWNCAIPFFTLNSERCVNYFCKNISNSTENKETFKIAEGKLPESFLLICDSLVLIPKNVIMFCDVNWCKNCTKCEQLTQEVIWKRPYSRQKNKTINYPLVFHCYWGDKPTL